MFARASGEMLPQSSIGLTGGNPSFPEWCAGEYKVQNSLSLCVAKRSASLRMKAAHRRGGAINETDTKLAC